jgi:hypothetical protein
VPCRFMHKNCGSDCDNHVCRAYFPLKQPLIDPKSKDVCLADDHETECLTYIEASVWREEKRIKGLTEKCPFAQNNICGKSWDWWCKGSDYPFRLTVYEKQEGKDDLPVRDSERNIKFTYDKEMVDSTCLSGDPSIYTTCPNYEVGMMVREFGKKLKSEKNSE